MPDDNDPFGFGIPLPLPAELEQFLRAAHDRQHMETDATKAKIDRFLTELDADALVALRTILCMGELKKSAMANWWDGQCVALLKYVHHVDPDTGKDPLALDDEGSS